MIQSPNTWSQKEGETWCFERTLYGKFVFEYNNAMQAKFFIENSVIDSETLCFFHFKGKIIFKSLLSHSWWILLILMSFRLKTNSHTSLVWPAKLTSMSHISVLDNLERETKEIYKSKEVNSYKAQLLVYNLLLCWCVLRERREREKTWCGSLDSERRQRDCWYVTLWVMMTPEQTKRSPLG